MRAGDSLRGGKHPPSGKTTAELVSLDRAFAPLTATRLGTPLHRALAPAPTVCQRFLEVTVLFIGNSKTRPKPTAVRVKRQGWDGSDAPSDLPSLLKVRQAPCHCGRSGSYDCNPDQPPWE